MRNQTAIEFLTTYAWAFILLGVFIVSALAFFTTPGSAPNTYLPSSCYISPSFPCSQALIFSNTVVTQFVVVLQNNLGVQMQFTKNSLAVLPGYYSGTSYNGLCFPINALPGVQIICNATLSGPSGNFVASIGTQLNPRFTITYQLCAPRCTLQVYNTSGTAVTVTTPTQLVLFPVTLLTSPASGNIVVAGVPYSNGVNVIFIQGVNYPTYGLVPNSLYSFNFWTPTGGIQIFGATQSTTTNAIGPGTLTANFIHN